MWCRGVAVITTAQLHLKNLNSGSTQAQILHTTCRRPVMVIASDNGLGGKQFYTSFFCQPFHTHTHKIIAIIIATIKFSEGLLATVQSFKTIATVQSNKTHFQRCYQVFL